MIRPRSTIQWVFGVLTPTMLGLALSIGLSACQSGADLQPLGFNQSPSASRQSPPPPVASTRPDRSAPAPPPVVRSERPHPAVEAAKQELGADAAEAIADLPRSEPDPPVEAGARAIIAAMIEAVPQLASSNEDEPTRIGVARLLNQSRATPMEFARFVERLAELLNRAGAERNIIFVNQPEEPVDYELRGTAYLITAAGLDQWELFLRLSLAAEAWTVWQSDGAIRVIRQARPDTNQPQILRWPQQESGKN